MCERPYTAYMVPTGMLGPLTAIIALDPSVPPFRTTFLRFPVN